MGPPAMLAQGAGPPGTPMRRVTARDSYCGSPLDPFGAPVAGFASAAGLRWIGATSPVAAWLSRCGSPGDLVVGRCHRFGAALDWAAGAGR
jgi:hypothetical protein